MHHHYSVSIAIIVAGSQLAAAQASGAQAEVLFKQAIALMDAGKFAEACAAFDASDKAEAAISTLLNRADCREKNGQYATAWGLFLDAERQTRTAPDVATQQLHLVAIDHAAKLEARLSRLTVTVPAESRIEGLQIVRGAEPVDPGAWNHPLPIDGGNYTITATAPGHEPWLTTIRVGAENDSKQVVVQALRLSPVVAPAPAHKPPMIAYALGGGAVVLLGASLGLELSARSTYDDAKKEPDDTKQVSLWHSANTTRYVDEGFLLGGLACAGLAVWQYLGHRRRESATQVSVVPAAGADEAGVQVFGRF